MSRLKLALAQFPIHRPPTVEAWQQSIADWVERAAGADLLVFPEYGGMALAGLLADDAASDLERSIDGMQAHVAMAIEHHRMLAVRHGVHILQGSLPLRVSNGRYVNRAYLHTASGGTSFQDKLIMTRFEREVWGIAGSGPLRVFRTRLGSIAVLICYDAEFPLLARACVEAGAQILLVPSCTETEAGYWRVRIGCQARALESQCLTAQSPTVGDALWSPAVDRNWGAAGLFGPPDASYSANGVLATGEPNESGWVFAEADLEDLAGIRADGDVFNFRDWAEQAEPVLPKVELVDLR